MDAQLTRCLNDLANRINEDEEVQIRHAWEHFYEDETSRGVFRCPQRTPKPPQIAWPDVVINDALADPTLMVLSEFKKISDVLAHGGDGVLNVRCNYGVSILASLFGCEVVVMPREQGNTPTCHALGDDEAIQAAIDRGVPNHLAGQGRQVFETGELFLEVLDRWPILKRHIELYHPDAQSPIDIAELVWGSDIFLAFYDQPERVHALIELLTQTYIDFLVRWFELVPHQSDYSAHWGLLIKGSILLRDDSLMNLSSEIYREFVRDSEQRCLDAFDGGAIHFCGRGDHFIEDLTRLDKLTAVHMSQPHLNNVEQIYQQTVDRGIRLLALEPDAVATAERDLLGKAQVVIRN